MDRTIDIPLAALFSFLVLLLIVIAALLQLFDASRGTVSGSSRSLSIAADYPSRLRANRDSYLRIDLANQSSGVLEDVAVSFDAAYFEGLARVSFVPAATRPWVVEYAQLGPGERRRIHIGIAARDLWSQSGSVTLSAAGQAPQRLEFSTFVIP